MGRMKWATHKQIFFQIGMYTERDPVLFFVCFDDVWMKLFTEVIDGILIF